MRKPPVPQRVEQDPAGPKPVKARATPPQSARETRVAAPSVTTRTSTRHPLRYANYAWIAGAALVVVLALYFLGPVLTPFLIGAILAYLGTPIVDWAERKGIPRWLSTSVVILLFALALIALLLVLVPLIRSQVVPAAQHLPDLFALWVARVEPWLQRYFGVTLSLDPASVKAFIAQNVEDAEGLSLRVLGGVRAGSFFLLSMLVNLVLIPIVMFYLLRDWTMITRRMVELVPRDWEAKVRTIVRDIDRVLAEFLRGQLLVMVALAAYYTAGLWFVGLDGALAIGMISGLLTFIPYVGFGIGMLLGVLAAVLQWSGWPGFLAVVAVFLVGQLLENYVLVPWLVGDRIGLHPLAVIFALLAFGVLFGFAGVLLALPVSAALLVGLRHLRAAYVESPIYRGTDT